MSITKLTLSADKLLVEDAKRFAASRNTSLSAMVARYFRAVARAETTEHPGLGPLTQEATGLVSFQAKPHQLLAEALWEKYDLSD